MSNALQNVKKLRNTVDVVADFNAVGDNSTVNTLVIQAAINEVAAAGGGTVEIPNGVFVTQTLTLKSNVRLVGKSRANSVLKLANNTNDDLLRGENANSLFGTNTDAGIRDFGLECLTLDGNRANNTAGSCLSFYGQRMVLRDLDILRAPHHGIRSEWYQFGEGNNGMEGVVDNVNIDNCGRHGWWFGGPHDSVVHNLVVIDPSQETDNTWDAIRIDVNGNARWSSIHTWTRSATSNITRYGVYVGTPGNEFTNSHFEGSKGANTYIVGGRNRFVNGMWYATKGTRNVVIRSSENYIQGLLKEKFTGAPSCIGITFGESGDSVIGNKVDVVSVAQEGGCFDFTFITSDNVIEARGTKSSGTSFVGTPGGTNEVSVAINGAAGYQLRKDGATSFLTAAGTTQANALDLSPFQYSTICTITTVASGTGVRLPSSIAGRSLVIKNRGANALSVYPPVGGSINALATNAAYSLTSGSAAWFICSETSNSRWETILGA